MYSKSNDKLNECIVNQMITLMMCTVNQMIKLQKSINFGDNWNVSSKMLITKRFYDQSQ